jgi:3-deoxy-D-arabino-heptulosonate 7-phosphate (DAHP) synthase
MITPEELKKLYEADEEVVSHVEKSRKIISDIVH